MARRHVDVPVPALALRRTEAAAALGLSVDHFDAHVRGNVPATRLGNVTVYPTAGLAAWLESNASTVVDDLTVRRAA